MKFFPSIKRPPRSGRKRRAPQHSHRRFAELSLRLESLEQRQLLSVSPTLLSDLNPGVISSFPSEFVEVGAAAFFVAADGVHGTELWKTDGTAAGTVIVKDIFPGSGDQPYAGDVPNSSSPQNLANVDGTLFFTADDGTHGTELWMSDATEAGTVMVKDIFPGTTDQPDVGEITNSSYPQSLANFNGTLFFAANDGTNGVELWKSDATEAGTMMVKDIFPDEVYYPNYGSFPGASFPENFTSINGTLYFTAYDGTSGVELWKSDGTADGTMIVKDLLPGTSSHPYLGEIPNSSYPLNLTNVDGTLFFSADDGNNSAGLWKSDGTTEGTVILKDLFPGGNVPSNYGYLPDSSPQNFTNVDGTLFFSADDGTHGVELWKSDGTAEGTVIVKDLFPGTGLQYSDYGYIDGPNSSSPQYLTNVDGQLFFSAEDDVHGRELWRSDGTAEGTTLLRDISPQLAGGYPTGSYPNNLTLVDGILHFVANDGTHGRELWASDGTSIGTFMVADLMAGNGGSQGASLTDVGGTLFFAANDGISGLEPWMHQPISSDDFGTLGGTVFDDLDGNGTRDSGEPGLADVTIYIDANDNRQLDGGELSTVTLVEGNYSFHAPPGTYRLRQQLLADTLQTFPVSPEDDPLARVVDLDLNDEIGGMDFGNYVVVAPAKVDLLPWSDSGIADDDVTNFDNGSPESAWTLLVTGVADGATIYAYVGDLRIAVGISVAGSATMTTDGEDPQADGPHSVTALQIFGGIESELSEPLIVTVDTIAPEPIDTTAPNLAQVGQPYQYDANSPDEGSPGITYLLIDPPEGATIDDSGVIDWTPTETHLTAQSFEIRVTDAAGNYAAQAVDVVVLGTVPAYPDSYTVNEDQTLNVNAASGVLENDGGDSPAVLTATLVTPPDHGTVELHANGSFTYTPEADFFGSDVFTYIADDGNDQSNEAQATITVAPVNDPPVSVDDTYSVDEDDPLHVSADTGVLDNDDDDGPTSLGAVLVDQPAHGSVTLNPDGSFTYTPEANFAGLDTFTYLASDGLATSALARVTINVAAVNDPPTAVSDSYDANEDGTLSVDASQGVLKNDSDLEGDAFTAAVNTLPPHGTLTLLDDGSFTYTPDDDFFGLDTFSYRASDADPSTAATVTINVQAQPDPPTAEDDQFEVTQDSAVNLLQVLENDDTEPDGSQTLQVVAVTQGSAGGVVSIAADGTSVEYTPPAGYVGTDTFTYTMQDSDGLDDQATAKVTVTEFVANSSISGVVYCDADASGQREAGELGIPAVMITLGGVDDQGTTVNLSVLTAGDGTYSFDELRPGTYQVVETQPTAMLDGEDTIGTLGGTTNDDRFSDIVLSGDSHSTGNNFGELGLRPEYISQRLFLASVPPPQQYLPEVMADAEEAAGNIELAAAIRQGSSDVPYNPPAPLALNDTFSVAEDEVLDVSAEDGVLANDADAGGTSDSLTAVLVSDPTDGTLTLENDGSFNYTPPPDFHGTDSFTYKAVNTAGESNEATATITVTPQQESISFAPIEDVVLLGGSPLLIPLDGQTSDGQALSFTAVSSNASLVATSIPEGNRSMRISVADHGDIVLELHENLVGEVTEPIIELAEDGFYDDVIFHRVIDNFMIQAGNAALTGGNVAEAGDFDDQFHVDLQHNRSGVLSMAKLPDDDTNGSQFFITEVPTRYLDFNHSVFGLLVEGESVRESISNVATDASDRPLVDVVMESVDIFLDEENAVLMLKAPEGAVAEADVTVTVTGENSQPYQQTFHVTVQPDTSNGGPFLDPIPTIQTTVDTPASLLLTAADAEGDPVLFSAVKMGNVDYSYTVDEESGLVTVTPPSGFIGMMEIRVRVRPQTTSDTDDTYDTQVVSILVTP